MNFYYFCKNSIKNQNSKNMLLSFILKDFDYKLAQFSEEKIHALESRIVERDNKYFVNCLIRKLGLFHFQ